MGKFESIFDPPMPPKAVVRKGPRPEEPPFVLCKHCGEMLWKVSAPNGADLLIDRYQIETETLLDGSVARLESRNRSPACNRHLRAQGGYAVLGAEWFGGWDAEEAGWCWYVSRMSLEDAEVTGTVIYSDHALTCEVIPEGAVIGKATASGLEGDAAGDRESKRGKGQRKLRLPPEFLRFRRPRKDVEMEALVKRLSAIKPVRHPRRITPDCLPLFAELGASREGSLLPEATETVLPEAAETHPDCGS